MQVDLSTCILMMTVMVGCSSSTEKNNGEEIKGTAYTGDPVEAIKAAVTKTTELDNFKLSFVSEWPATKGTEQDQEIFDIYTDSDGIMSMLFVEQEYVKKPGHQQIYFVRYFHLLREFLPEKLSEHCSR